MLSPSTGRIDRIRKTASYARVGVPQLWLLDPLLHTLEVFRLQQGVFALVQALEGEGSVRPEPFNALEFSMAEWWGEDPADP